MFSPLLRRVVKITFCDFHSSYIYRLNSWIKAHSHLHNREYNQAIATFRQLEDRGTLRDNLNLLVAMGESYHYSGDHKNALIVLQRVSDVYYIETF